MIAYNFIFANCTHLFLFLLGPIHSGLVNKFGCRPVCVFGSLLSATGFFIASFSSSLSILIITYGVIGGKLYKVLAQLFWI